MMMPVSPTQDPSLRAYLDGLVEEAANSSGQRARQRILSWCFLALFRWYEERAIRKRNWSPDASFDWTEGVLDHNEDFSRLVVGFFAVEQYAPDYTAELCRLVRDNYGQSQFQLRWGMEESRHAGLWRNVISSREIMAPGELDEYAVDLRKRSWTPPHDTPLSMLIYTVFQERATQITYNNFLRYLNPPERSAESGNQPDPKLLGPVRAIIADEVAHFHFFLEGARIYLALYPDETLETIRDVVETFEMPGVELVPEYDLYAETIYRNRIFSRLQHGRSVVRFVLESLRVPKSKKRDTAVSASVTETPLDRHAPLGFLSPPDPEILRSLVERFSLREAAALLPAS